MSEPSVSQPTSPFDNFKTGFRAIWRTNFKSIIVLQIILNLGSALAVFALMRHFRLDETSKQIKVIDPRGFASALIIVPVLIVGSLIASLAQSRLILAGVRQKTETIGQALSFAVSRLWLMVKLSLIFVGALFTAGAVIGLLSAILPPLAILGLIALAVAGVFLAIRLAFVTFLVVDNHSLTASDTIKRAFNLSQAYLGQITGMGLIALAFIVGASIVASIFFGESSMMGAKQIKGTADALGSFINGLIMIPAYIAAEAGFAELYRQATRRQT